MFVFDSSVCAKETLSLSLYIYLFVLRFELLCLENTGNI